MPFENRRHIDHWYAGNVACRNHLERANDRHTLARNLGLHARNDDVLPTFTPADADKRGSDAADDDSASHTCVKAIRRMPTRSVSIRSG
jgi:hypothetical protein